MARLFGTDGVRGLANRDLTAELALDLSVAAAHVLADLGAFEGHRPVAVVGRDSRASGEFLAAAAAAGLASAGVDVLDVGVLPTPAVAHLTESTGADLGVMLSASHNPMPDNGLKFFARGGRQARRRARGRRRSPDARAVGPPDRVPPSDGSDPSPRAPRTTSAPSARSCPDLARRPDRGAGLRPRRGLAGRAGGAAPGGGFGHRPRRPSPTAGTSTTAAGRPTSAPLQRAVVEQGADLGHRPRRRRRPLPRGGGRRRGRRRRPDPGRARARPARGGRG